MYFYIYYIEKIYMQIRVNTNKLEDPSHKRVKRFEVRTTA